MSLIIMGIAETYNYSVTPYEILCLNIAEILRVYILFKSLESKRWKYRGKWKNTARNVLELMPWKCFEKQIELV